MENIQQMSLLEVALKIMSESNEPKDIYELIKESLALKEINDEDGTLTASLYVDITTSSKFVFMGDDKWELKERQPLSQFDKDGSAFFKKDEEYEDDEDDENEGYELEDDEELSIDDEDDDEEKSYDEDDEESYDQYENEYEGEDSYDDEDDESYNDDENDFDEDKYNDLMDDYEDQYE